MSGYVAFGKVTRDDVFLSFTASDQDVFVNVGRTLLCCALCVSIPLNIYPCRATAISLASQLLTNTSADQDLAPEIQIFSPSRTVREGVAQANHAYDCMNSNVDHRGAQPFVRMISPGAHSHPGSPILSSRAPPECSSFTLDLDLDEGSNDLDEGLLADRSFEAPMALQPSLEERRRSSSVSTATVDSSHHVATFEDPPLSVAGWAVHVSAAAFIVISSMLVAFVIPSISTVMGILGGVCGVFQMYILPGLVLIRCKKLYSPWKRILTLLGFTIAALVGSSSVVLAVL
eukprot:TRINITY_DN110844_c0_g1_i1.p1 TRINITY_DN110844_c0_g1~~TRINITY_DN110844_c0_g1_i1.p1  ORF type:complete len:300 (-),score=19.47 TRINITY_DN110844_c0_g1_i1:106-969(-)